MSFNPLRIESNAEDLIRSLEQDCNGLFTSFTWRSGRVLAEAARILLFRPRTPTVEDHIYETLAALRRELGVDILEGQQAALPIRITRARSVSLLAGASSVEQVLGAIADSADVPASNLLGNPLISLLVPVYKPKLSHLRSAVESVLNQEYRNWELCIVDDGSGRADLSNYLSSIDDPRVKISLRAQNRGIAAASNAALAMATGHYIALLDHDDELTPDALGLMAEAVMNHDPDLVYSDEAKLDAHGQIVEPHHKPSFSRFMIQSQNYISHLGVYRKAIVDDIGGFRAGVDGSQDHDLLLRFLARSHSIAHIPRVLYLWRKVRGSTAERFADKDYAWEAGVKALQHVHGELATGASVEKGVYPGTYRVRYPITGSPKVSILIPFRDQPGLLEDCLRSLIDKTSHENYEIIGIDNQSQDRKTGQVMTKWEQRDARIRFVDFDAPFNYAAINNFAVTQAAGEYLCLLNNDITIKRSEWLTALLELGQLPGVGAVGGMLLYPDETLQHAGCILGIGGVAGHSHKYFPASHHGYFSRPHLIQNVSAVTGACLLVKKAIYGELDGLDEENLKVAFNDIDFCLRLLDAGYENVYTPYAVLYHHESKSRGYEDSPEKRARFEAEVQFMKRRHAERLSDGDPWYNPNLTLISEDFSLQPSVGV